MMRSGETVGCWKCQGKATKVMEMQLLTMKHQAMRVQGVPLPTPFAKTKRPPERKQAKEEKKGKKGGDDDIKKSLDAIVNARKEMAKERKIARMKEVEEARVTEERRAVAEERRAAAEERLAAVEERKISMEEAHRLAESERSLFMMNTSELDEKQKEYINMLRNEVLAKKRMMMKGGYMGAPMAGMGGMGGYMGAPMAGMGGMGGAMAGMGGMGGAMAGMGGMPAMGGMPGMGGMSSSMGASMPPMGGGMGASMGGYMAAMGGMSDFGAPTDDDVASFHVSNTAEVAHEDDAQNRATNGEDEAWAFALFMYLCILVVFVNLFDSNNV